MMPRLLWFAAALLAAAPAGLRYWLRLEGGGVVSEDRLFRTGEAIRIHLRSDVDGCFAIWALDSAGRAALLFPRSGESGQLRAGIEHVTPGRIKFAEPPEEERLVLFFARSASELPAGPEAVAKALDSQGARDLQVRAETQDAAQPGLYLVHPFGGPLIKQIRLKHR